MERLLQCLGIAAAYGIAFYIYHIEIVRNPKRLQHEKTAVDMWEELAQEDKAKILSQIEAAKTLIASEAVKREIGNFDSHYCNLIGGSRTARHLVEIYTALENKQLKLLCL